MENLSLLKQCEPRDLPIALAHCLAACKPGAARLDVLNRIYNRLSFAEAFRCRNELLECRWAKQQGKIAAVKA